MPKAAPVAARLNVLGPGLPVSAMPARVKAKIASMRVSP
jgi:hypothetical protein